MLETIIPKNVFDTTTYPNLEANAEGLPIPYLYGDKSYISPVMIDTSAHKYKIAGHQIKAITWIHADGELLTVTDDYTADLPNGEFTLKITPFLSPSTTYYLVFNADFAINASNYLFTGSSDPGDHGELYEINGSDVWSATGNSMFVRVWGKDDIDSDETIRLDTRDQAGDHTRQKLRDHADRTKVAQAVTVGATGYYITRIQIFWTEIGSPSGDIWAEIHTGTPGSTTQVGIDSIVLPVATSWFMHRFRQRGIPSEILVRAIGRETGGVALDQADEILNDILTTMIGVDSGDLDTAEFTTLASNRTEVLATYIDTEIPFRELCEKLESTSRYKFISKLNGLHAPIVYVSGEPSGTYHLKDEDFIKGTFKMLRVLESVKRKGRIKYDMNPTTQIHSIKEAESDLARYAYNNDETFEVETILTTSGNATSLADAYLALFESPQIKVEFEVRGSCVDNIPTNKVKITRTRACFSGGSLSAELFRIFSITKRKNGNVRIEALLDSQSY